MRYRLMRKQGIAFWTVPYLERLGCRVCFFLRQGGVSGKPFQTLNVGLNTADDPRNVHANRQKAVRLAGLGPNMPVVGQQMHGIRIRQVDLKHQGQGWNELQNALPNTDALFTTEQGLPLAVTVADCVPVLLIHEKGSAVAAIHAGWKGIAGQIIGHTISRILRKTGFVPQSFHAVIGPAIGPDHFEVKEDALKSLGTLHPSAIYRKMHKDKVYFNLWAAANEQLIQAGVHHRQITLIPECTYCYTRKYFSYRRDGGITGRMMAIVQINEHRTKKYRTE